MDEDKDTYGKRYKRRWGKCFYVWGAIFGLSRLSTYSTAGSDLVAFGLDVLIVTAVCGAVFGTVTCLLVAAFPSRKPKAVQP